MPKVVHICPTYFSPDSVIAGGERYSFELARAMARHVPTTLLTFGDEPFTRQIGRLEMKCLRRTMGSPGTELEFAL